MVFLLAVCQPGVRPVGFGESAHEGVGGGERGAGLLGFVVEGQGAGGDGGRQHCDGGRPGAGGVPGLVGELLAVSAGSNRSKGDQGPEEWQPPLGSYWCVYGRSWTSVKATYELTVTEDEKNWLTKMLDTCA
ncbi:hypothetical protein [Streptomyces olivaceus]|uniref:hypothetical protein n=1 Tax=Streptomyces olivaceus TaxID=47716 RepID=UPI000A72AFFC